MRAQLILTFLFVFVSLSTLQAQDLDINQCGLDSAYSLNSDEVAYFNEVLAEPRGEFDFEGKRLAFALGNSGNQASNKSRYFKKGAIARYESGDMVVNQLLILTEAERLIAPEIDAIIVSWSKVAVEGRKREKLIRRFGMDAEAQK